jgi:hypothetical protein
MTRAKSTRRQVFQKLLDFTEGARRNVLPNHVQTYPGLIVQTGGDLALSVSPLAYVHKRIEVLVPSKATRL